MPGNQDFYTVRGYDLMDQECKEITHSMEDYLEMIYRFAGREQEIRAHDLAEALNVKPPSTTKMVQKLAQKGYLNYQRYGAITLTAKGREYGAYLLRRHNSLADFLKMLGASGNLQEDTERLEHNLSRATMENLASLTEFLRQNPAVLAGFQVWLGRKTAEG